MNTHSNRPLLLLMVALATLSLNSAGPDPGNRLLAGAPPSLCAAVPERMPIPTRNPGDRTGLAAATAPEASIAGLLGTLGQMIVEAELSHAGVSGRFEPAIDAAVAGSTFTLEVCHDTIVGRMSMAGQSRLRFVIGDFDGDGTTDVAVRRDGSRSWSVDLGAVRRAITAGLGTPARLLDAVQPAARANGSQVTSQVTWLVERLRTTPVESPESRRS